MYVVFDQLSLLLQTKDLNAGDECNQHDAKAKADHARFNATDDAEEQENASGQGNTLDNLAKTQRADKLPQSCGQG